MKKTIAALMLVVLLASVGSTAYASFTDHSVENAATLGKGGGNGGGHGPGNGPKDGTGYGPGNGTNPDCPLLPPGK